MCFNFFVLFFVLVSCHGYNFPWSFLSSSLAVPSNSFLSLPQFVLNLYYSLDFTFFLQSLNPYLGFFHLLNSFPFCFFVFFLSCLSTDWRPVSQCSQSHEAVWLQQRRSHPKTWAEESSGELLLSLYWWAVWQVRCWKEYKWKWSSQLCQKKSWGSKGFKIKL